MKRFAEIEYVSFEENKDLENLIDKVLEECFKTEQIDDYKLYISVTLTNPEYIRKLNNKLYLCKKYVKKSCTFNHKNTGIFD